MGRPSATKKQTTTTSATVDETMVAENSQNVVVDNAEIEEKLNLKQEKLLMMKRLLSLYKIQMILR